MFISMKEDKEGKMNEKNINEKNIIKLLEAIAVEIGGEEVLEKIEKLSELSANIEIKMRSSELIDIKSVIEYNRTICELYPEKKEKQQHKNKKLRGQADVSS